MAFSRSVLLLLMLHNEYSLEEGRLLVDMNK